MTQTFKLKRGEILFEKDKIYISDKAKSDKYFRLSTSLFLLVFGIINIRKFYREGDHFFYSFWLILVILTILTIAFTLSRSTKGLILLDEVKSIKVNKRFDNCFLDIRLKNNRLRRVTQIEDYLKLEEYIETYFDGFNGKLNL